MYVRVIHRHTKKKLDKHWKREYTVSKGELINKTARVKPKNKNMNVEQKIEQARAKQAEEKRDSKGKFRKLTITERCGKWTISWVIFWAICAGSSWTYIIQNKTQLIQSETIIVENAQAQTTIDAKIEEEAPQKAEFEGIEAEVTAYNAKENQTDSNPYEMASTRRVYEGALACPLKYKFGTRIEIEGLGVYTCEDRMAKEKREGEYFDIFMWDEDEAWDFGKKKLNYKVIN